MSDTRSLKFVGQVTDSLYDAQIVVTGGVTGMKYGTLLLTRADLVELEQLVSGLLNELDDKEVKI